MIFPLLGSSRARRAPLKDMLCFSLEKSDLEVALSTFPKSVPPDLLKVRPRSKPREREQAQAELEIYCTRIDEGCHRRYRVPLGTFPPLQSVAECLTVLSNHYDMWLASPPHLN